MNALLQRLDALDARCRGAVLGIGRIMLGLLWLANIHWKVPGDFGEGNGGGLFKYSSSVSRNSTFAPFTWITEQFVLPNFVFFGWFTLLTEITLAALLLVGYRTKIVALAGAAMSVPIMLSVLYYDKADEWSWSYLLMIAAHLMAYASDAGNHLGIDGVLRRGPQAARRAMLPLGIVTTVIGLAGLFVSRSMSFTGRKVALLGSDAGFSNADGSITRRWELKFVWFNPLWAILMIVFGLLILASVKQQRAAQAAGVGLAVIALLVFATRTFDYARDDGGIQKIATGSNAALWGGLALAVLLFDRAIRAGRTDPSVASIDE